MNNLATDRLTDRLNRYLSQTEANDDLRAAITAEARRSLINCDDHWISVYECLNSQGDGALPEILRVILADMLDGRPIHKNHGIALLLSCLVKAYEDVCEYQGELQADKGEDSYYGPDDWNYAWALSHIDECRRTWRVV